MSQHFTRLAAAVLALLALGTSLLVTAQTDTTALNTTVTTSVATTTTAPSAATVTATTTAGTTVSDTGATTSVSGTTVTTLDMTTAASGTTTTAPNGEAPPSNEDPFEAWLDEQGFPESYRAPLRALHAQYPNWVFRAQHTGLTWKEVLDAEAALGVSLVPTGSIASWKSCAYGAYNPATGVWNGLDSAAWVAADRGIVAYCLDPRNALTATAIFQFENLAYSDTCTVEGVKAILAGTFMAEGEWAEWFMLAGREAGVSPYHLASRARQEQGVYGNALGHGNAGAPYNGYYNLFNINAYATATLSPIQNGARYAATTNAAYHLPWTSALLSIRGGAVILGNSYINREQNTLYLQKFDVTDGGNGLYRHQYMTNIFAPTSEATTLSGAYTDEVKAGAMEFCIPVYKEMPEEACTKPTSTGSNDNWLSALTVTDRTFTPAFSTYRTAYELSVPNMVSSLRVNAVAYSATATVSGTGTVPLKSGMNAVSIKVTAASGAVRVYTLSVYRTPSETGDQENAPTLKSETYRIEDTIQGIAPGTAADAFLKGFTLSDSEASLIVVDKDGARVTGTVGTGCVLHVFKGDTLFAVYPLLIRGDVSGDGAVSIVDLLQIQQHLLKVRTLTDHWLHAADVSLDGAVSIVDLLKTQQHLLKVTVIEQ